MTTTPRSDDVMTAPSSSSVRDVIADAITYHPGNRAGTPDTRHPVSLTLADRIIAELNACRMFVRAHDDESDYERLRDRIVELCNPLDDDAAEVAILLAAVTQLRDFVLQAADCTCADEDIDDHDPCSRCRVLGRLGDKAVER